MILGVDIGGTFTDFVLFRDGKLAIHKLLTTPDDPSEALCQGLKDFNVPSDCPIVHGSTVATNAVLEREGATTAIITTKGFKDVLEIGRQTRPSLYDLMVDRPPLLVPSERRFEVSERIDYTGTVIQPLSTEEIGPIMRLLQAQNVGSVAICFLFSFLNPVHECLVRDVLLREQDTLFVSLSSEILPEYREYERISTVTVNAYVSPIISLYIAKLRTGLGHSFRIMQSSGGSISAETAINQPVRTILSGPAGGVVGAYNVALASGFNHVITFDMGGTSTDVSLCPGYIQETTESSIDGYPLRVPMIDIHTVGAGGGSIARIDSGGALTVGPESAGADPGPVCYGKGQDITVTDANLILGRLDVDYFLGGRMYLDYERTKSHMERLAQTMGTSIQQAAQGIIRVANSNMERAIRVISVERGFDPRDFVLVAFGGAGPAHACDLARELHIPRVLIPRHPGVLSAMGIMMSDIIKDYSTTVMLGEAEAGSEQIQNLLEPLERRGWMEMLAEGIPAERIRIEKFLDMRYRGQAYELTTVYESPGEPAINSMGRLAAIERFHKAHQQRFAYSNPERAVEIVNLRLRAVGLVDKPSLERENFRGEDASEALLGQKAVLFAGQLLTTALYERSRLHCGNRIAGPAIIFQFDSTVVIPPSWTGIVDPFHNLLISPSTEGG
ncbi:MAG: hydantoinase/oxoprolinase family protein [Chloroflexi bacterium]|nr:hydantoinase/oxoprolinase family protein [Chloroflexota bacterium]MCL5074983.1 hydantoinase/oxoprolinase family protein [Chloroflexota bacterium]